MNHHLSYIMSEGGIKSQNLSTIFEAPEVYKYYFLMQNIFIINYFY